MTPDPWLEALFDPAKVIAASRGQYSTHVVGLARLLSGDIQAYRRYAESNDLPQLASGMRPVAASREDELLYAAGLQLFGDIEALEMYERLALTEAGDGVNDVAAVLASMLCRDAGDFNRSRRILASRTPSDALSSAVVSLHLAVTLALEGNYDEASVAARASEVKLRSEKIPRPWRDALLAIHDRNEWFFERWSGSRFIRMKGFYSRSSRLFDPTDDRISSSLKALVDEQFETSISSVHTRTMRIANLDPVDSPLQAALLRAECMADLSEVIRLSSLLAKRQIAGAVAPGDRGADALLLLVSSVDHQAVASASRTYAVDGPLNHLHTAARAVLARRWPPHMVVTSLSLVGEAWDVLDHEEAEKVMERALHYIRDADRNTEVAAIKTALRVSARIERTALLDQASEAMMSVAVDEDSAFILQTIAQDVQSLVSQLTDPSDWRLFAETNLMGSGDRGLVARSALMGLDSDSRSSILTSAFEAGPPTVEVIELARLAMASGVQLSDDQSQAVIRELLDRIRDVKDAASRGSYSFGGLDAPAMLASLALGVEPPTGTWDDLTSLLVDPTVSVSDKAGLAETLAHRHEELPDALRSALARTVTEPVGRADEFFASKPAYEGALLRLHLAIDGGSRLLARFIALASSENSDARRQAALTAPYALRTLDPAVVDSTLLQLIRDRNPFIRSQAAFALAGPRMGVDTLGQVRSAAVMDALRAEGSIVPLGALSGLLANSSSDESLGMSREVGDLVRSIAKRHLSAAVRAKATEVIQTVGPDRS